MQVILLRSDSGCISIVDLVKLTSDFMLRQSMLLHEARDGHLSMIQKQSARLPNDTPRCPPKQKKSIMSKSKVSLYFQDRLSTFPLKRLCKGFLACEIKFSATRVFHRDGASSNTALRVTK